MNDAISVIIPVYNRESLVGRTLDSVYAQTYRPIELIIVDNNSTDNTLARVAEWSSAHQDPSFRITTLQETTPGACAARQKDDVRGASELLENSLMNSDIPLWRKLLLRCIYAYTSRGGRCAYLLWR